MSSPITFGGRANILLSAHFMAFIVQQDFKREVLAEKKIQNEMQAQDTQIFKVGGQE